MGNAAGVFPIRSLRNAVDAAVGVIRGRRTLS